MQFVLYLTFTVLNFIQALAISFIKEDEIFISYSIIFINLSLLLPLMSYSISNIFQKRYAFANGVEEKLLIFNKCKKIILLSSFIFFIPSILLIEFLFPNKFIITELFLIVFTAFLIVCLELNAAKFRIDKDSSELVRLFKRRIFFEHLVRFPVIIFFCNSQTSLCFIIFISQIPAASIYLDRNFFHTKVTLSDSLLSNNFGLFIASLFAVSITFYDKILLSDILDTTVLATLFICARFSNIITVFFTKTYSLYLQGKIYSDVKKLSSSETESYFRKLYLENFKYSFLSSGVLFIVSLVALKFIDYLQLYTLTPNYPFIFGAASISAFIFSLNFTASYQLTSKELFNEYAVINVASVAGAVFFSSFLVKHPLDLLTLSLLIISPAYINYMIINIWVALRIDLVYFKNIFLVNIIPLALIFSLSWIGR